MTIEENYIGEYTISSKMFKNYKKTAYDNYTFTVKPTNVDTVKSITRTVGKE
jgi:hypothetical protein